MNILVVGGAGYIGSHMVKRLGQLGCRVTTLDNLSAGHRNAVLCGELVQGDMADVALLNRVFAQGQFDAVMHFASFIQVGESVQEPAKYYANNVVKTLQLLDVMRAHGVKQFIFRPPPPPLASRSMCRSTRRTPSNRSIPMAAPS